MQDETVLEAYREYVDQQKIYLFGDKPIQEVLQAKDEGHRTRRFVDLYMLRTRDGFWKFSGGDEHKKNVSRVTAALFRKTNKSDMCKSLCSIFINEYAIPWEKETAYINDQEVLQVLKGLDSFIATLVRQTKSPFSEKILTTSSNS